MATFTFLFTAMIIISKHHHFVIDEWIGGMDSLRGVLDIINVAKKGFFNTRSELGWFDIGLYVTLEILKLWYQFGEK